MFNVNLLARCLCGNLTLHPVPWVVAAAWSRGRGTPWTGTADASSPSPIPAPTSLSQADKPHS